MPPKKLSVLALLALFPPLFAASPETARHIDREWFRQTLAGETAHWRQAAFRPNGFFAVSLDRQWRPVGSQNGTLVTQGRQITVMAAGYDLTHEPAYLEAVKKGADFLLEYFRDTEKGLFFYSVTPEGKVVDDSKDSYGMAFAILGLSRAALVTKDKRYSDAALETWAQMKEHLREENALFKPKMDRDYARVTAQNTQNPMMHLFEALLALHDATGSKAVFRDAQAHADAIFTRLFDSREGRLPELYDRDWKPAPPEQGGYFELAHQFEWAFLLSHAVEKGFPKRYLAIGQRLLNYGMKVGYDEEEGGVFSRGDYQAKAVRGPKGWWEQCESLRTMMHYAALRGRKDLWPAFDKTLDFARKNLIDPEYGGWYYSYDPKTPRQRTGKGGVWQAGYHVCGMYREALRLAGPAR
jgi:mannose/cellobiose epimerase-like protein (N-acyl-D-glucosamine 2-epimerase family)